jgi:hypothetical protein
MGWRRAVSFLCLLAVLGGLAWGQEGGSRLAVLPLHGTGEGHFGTPDDEMYQMVVATFLKTRRFDLLERHRLDDVLHEAKFQNSGLVDDSSAVALGKLLGVKWVVIGSYKGELVSIYGDKKAEDSLFRYFTGKVVLSLRMVDVETGKIQETFDAAGGSRDSTLAKAQASLLLDCTGKLEREVANKFPLRGVVLRVEKEKEIMTDLGRKDGLAVGDRFQIMAVAEDAIHPVTGKVIKGAPRPVAEAEVLSVGEESSIMKITDGKDEVKPGLFLESIKRKAGRWERFMDKLK